METITTVNPYNQQQLHTYSLISEEELQSKIQESQSAFKAWQGVSIKKRCKKLKALAELLLERKTEYATLITQEMGKPISQSVAEIEKCAWLCEFYTKNSEDFLADQLIKTEAHESFISYDPLGVILGIMPWNYPFWQVLRFAVPTLMAGNTVLLKHSSNVTGCSLAIDELFKDSSFDAGCFQTLLIDHHQVEVVISNPCVKAISLTGSEAAGRAVAQTSGKYLKKTVLELGGNNACIILKDADLDKHIKTIVWARMQNAGQSCIAAKRFIIVQDIYDTFVEQFKKEIESLSIGDPNHPEVEFATMAREDLAQEVKKQVANSIKMGAKLLVGNSRKKAFYEPTIITDVRPGMPLFDEEVFGPVAAFIKVQNREEAFELASKSKYGLGTMVFTKNIKKVFKSIGQIEDGAYFINDLVKSDPRLPFGGTKLSGYGRELSKEGIMEFVNKKTVYIKKS